MNGKPFLRKVGASTGGMPSTSSTTLATSSDPSPETSVAVARSLDGAQWIQAPFSSCSVNDSPMNSSPFWRRVSIQYCPLEPLRASISQA